MPNDGVTDMESLSSVTYAIPVSTICKNKKSQASREKPKKETIIKDRCGWQNRKVSAKLIVMQNRKILYNFYIILQILIDQRDPEAVDTEGKTLPSLITWHSIEQSPGDSVRDNKIPKDHNMIQKQKEDTTAVGYVIDQSKPLEEGVLGSEFVLEPLRQVYEAALDINSDKGVLEKLIKSFNLSGPPGELKNKDPKFPLEEGIVGSEFVLEPLWQVYEAALDINGDKGVLEKLIKSFNFSGPPGELKNKDPKFVLQSVMSRWLPLSDAIFLCWSFSNPFVFVSVSTRDEHVLAAAGKVHLERCIKDLKDKFAKMILDALEQVGGIYVVTANHGDAEDMVKRNNKCKPILKDGEVTHNGYGSGKSSQEKKIIYAIVKSCKLPLSIVLVGVGDRPWDKMKLSRYDFQPTQLRVSLIQTATSDVIVSVHEGGLMTNDVRFEDPKRLRFAVIHGLARMVAIMASTYKAYLVVGLGPLLNLILISVCTSSALCHGAWLGWLDFRGLLPPLFEEQVMGCTKTIFKEYDYNGGEISGTKAFLFPAQPI
ncbi:elongation factor-like GTPase 1 [Artemisia annua]|uniref:Elongation factor-like GTPase 1 n=1 Tax=Artemisia annua TaxID=35608 RepID=A0A2U1N1J9_ARTAN|nr:elongation factor-like GTPase 1 [Artemisia annua]